eukprot:RCo006017
MAGILGGFSSTPGSSALSSFSSFPLPISQMSNYTPTLNTFTPTSPPTFSFPLPPSAVTYTTGPPSSGTSAQLSGSFPSQFTFTGLSSQPFVRTSTYSYVPSESTTTFPTRIYESSPAFSTTSYLLGGLPVAKPEPVPVPAAAQPSVLPAQPAGPAPTGFPRPVYSSTSFLRSAWEGSVSTAPASARSFVSSVTSSAAPITFGSPPPAAAPVTPCLGAALDSSRLRSYSAPSASVPAVQAIPPPAPAPAPVPIPVPVPVPAPVCPPVGRTRALLIGVNYNGLDRDNQLFGAANDARCLGRFLEDQGWDRTTIVVMDEGQVDAELLPTRENVLRMLDWLTEDAQPGDALFFGFSGHGTQLQRQHGDGVDADGVVAMDLQLVLHDDLYPALARKLPCGTRLTAVLDCAFAGTVLNLPHTLLPGQSVGYSPPAADCSSTGEVVVFSSFFDEAEEREIDSQASRFGGACTNALLSALSVLGGANVTYSTLLAEMEAETRVRELPHIPMLSSTHPLRASASFTLTPQGDAVSPLPTRHSRAALNPYIRTKVNPATTKA